MARRADEVNTWGEGLSEALLDELPQSLVDAVIREYGKQAQRRSGKLPPELVAYLVVFMGLYRHLSIPCVLERLVATVGMPRSWKGGKTPCATAITQARDRLGWESLRKLFCRHAKHLTEEHAAVDHRTDAVDEGQEAALAGGAGDAELQFGVRVKDALVVELELDEGLIGDDGLQDRGLHVDGLVGADRPNLDEVGDSSVGSSSWRCVSHYIQF